MRRNEFDFIKGCLILFVVWGHCCMYNSGTDYDKNFLTSYIRLFQMPLFIFISGFFQKDIYNLEQIKAKLNKTFVTLVIPILSYYLLSISTIAITNIFLQKEFEIEELLKGHISILWYLLCLLMCVLFYIPLNYLSVKIKRFGEVLLCISPLFVMLIPSNVFNFQFLWQFFLLGVLYNRYEEKVNNVSTYTKSFFISICFAIFIISGLVFPSDLTFYNYNNTLVGGGLLIKLMRIIVYLSAVISAFFILLFIYNHSNSVFCKYMSNIGKQTLTIYVLHLIILVDIVKPLIVCYYGQGSVFPYNSFLRFYFLSVIETFILVSFTYIMALYIGKNRLLNLLFMGGRNL